MRLTTWCVCGTLLAFSSWIRAEEGPLLGHRGFRPCAASLRPVGACRPGQHDSTCPYLLSLPPLTVHLPRHLRELENIMQDLKKLKDSVDELRKMCADCTGGRTERKCGGQREREREKQIEGKSEDVGSGMNVRLEETGRGFKCERGNDGGEVEKTDADNSTEKGWTLEWETDGKSNKEVVKDNEREDEDLTEGEEQDRKTKNEPARDEDRLEQEKVPTAGGNTRTVDVTSEEVFGTTHGETTDLLDALKGNLKGFQEDMLENEEEKKMSTDVKNQAKTKEDGDLYVWRDEINRTDKKTKTEAGDRIKMSENHENREENINKEREQLREETRKEEGIKVDQNNEKVKHTESTGQTEKEKAIKEGEVDEKGREMATEIKTKSVQRNSDEALSRRKTTEGTDFLLISPTPISTTKLASKPDPNKVTIFTSSLPSPPLPSSTLSSIADVSRDTKEVYGRTPSTGLGAADISEAESRDADSATRTNNAPGGDRREVTSKTTGLISAFTVRPGAGLQGHERSTTTSPTTTSPHQKLNTTTSRVPDHRRWTPKKNISSNIKTGLKPPPGRVLRPGDKHKPGIKPEAAQKLKNPKNDRKPNQAPAPDKKPKYNQKQNPAPPRSTSEKPKPGKDSGNIHVSKPDQKTTPPILATDKNRKTNLTHPSPQNKLPFHKPKPSVQKPASQRPQTVKTSHSDPSNNKKHVVDKIPIIDKNSKSETGLVRSFTTNKPDQTERPDKTSENEEKSKLNEKFDEEQNLNPVQESAPKTNQTESFTPKPKQQHLTESVETSDEDLSQESNSNVKPGQKITSSTVNVNSDQMNKPSHENPETKRKLVQEPGNINSETTTAKPNNKLLTENVKKSDENPLEEPESNLDLISGQKILLNQVNETSDQMNTSSQEISKFKPKPIKEPTSKTETAATKHNQKPSTESVIKSNKNIVQEPESNSDLLSGQKTTFDQVNATSDQVNTSKQGTPKIKHQPKFKQWPKTHKSESGKPNPKQKPLTKDKSVGNPLQKPESNHKTISIKPKPKPKPNQEPKPKTEPPTAKPDQNPSKEYVVDENPLQEPESNQGSNNEQTLTSSPIKALSGQKNKSSQEISRSKPKTKPKLTEEPTSKTETAAPKPDQQSSAESVVNKNSVREPESDPDLLSGQKTTSDQVDATSDQMNTSNQGTPKIKHQQPKLKQWPKTHKSESGELNPKQNLLTEDKSAKNILQEPESNQDLNNERTVTSGRVTATSDQTPESSQEILSVKPKPNQEHESETKTATPKPDQTPSTESDVDGNPLQEPESSQEIFSGKHKPKPNQEFKPKTETATLEPDDNPSTESNQNPFQEPESKQNLNNERTITSGRVTATSDQTPESSQENFNIKHKPKPNQEPESKTKTATPKPDQIPSTESDVDENPLQEPESNQDLNYEQTITSNRVKTTSDQMPDSRQEIFNTKPKPNQEPEPKTETATPKPDYNPLTESEVDKTLLQKPESNQDLLPGQKITSDQVDQITDSNQDDFKIQHKPNYNKEPKSKKSETATLGPDRKFFKESAVKSEENPLQEPESNKKSTSGQTHAADKAKKVPVQKFKPSDNAPIINKRPRPGPEPKQNQKHPKPVTGLKNKPNTNLHTERIPQTNTSFKTPRPDQNLKLKLFFKPKNISTANTNRTSKPRPPFQQRPLTRPWIKPGAKPIQRPKLPMRPKPSPKTKTRVDPPKINWAPPENTPNSQTDIPSTSGSATQTSEVTHSPGETDFSTSTRKTITRSPKTSDSLESEHSPHLHTHTEDFTSSPNSRIPSDLRPQTASRPPSIPMTTRSNKILRGTLQRVITSTNPGSTQPSPVPKSDFGAQDKILYSTEETAPANPILSPSLETTFTPRPDFRSMTWPTSGPEPSATESTTPSARELRVKINQVAAFVNNSLNPKVGPGAGLPKQHLQGSQRGSGPDTKPTSVQTKVMRDCSDHLLRGETRSGVYLVTPDLRSSSFQVFCDMERDGGGWTLLQRRQDGSVSFNRTWAEYQSGFGVLDGGEFWLGNRMIHLLTRDRDMALRVELEDFEGVTEHAQYEQFRVAGERQRYKLTVGGYSGTAGDALRFSKRYDHNNRAFTTPDRDHDRYPSGNCGAYYSSGWWFDACMAANLNGKYYVGHYKGVRNGIFWGTWHNISKEYYPTNERQSFKTVRMMIRPKSFAP